MQIDEVKNSLHILSDEELHDIEEYIYQMLQDRQNDKTNAAIKLMSELHYVVL